MVFGYAEAGKFFGDVADFDLSVKGSIRLHKPALEKSCIEVFVACAKRAKARFESIVTRENTADRFFSGTNVMEVRAAKIITFRIMKKNLHGIASESLINEFTLFTNDDIELFHAGRHCELYRLFGAHVVKNDGLTGMYFAVWAPSVMQMSVMGSFNGWDKNSHKLIKRADHSNIWEGFVTGVIEGKMYKFVLTTPQGIEIEKADPFAFAAEHPPHTSSVTRDLKYKWSDAKWMKHREQKNSLQAPISVYAVHL